MQEPVFRLDDLARLTFHSDPETALQLFDRSELAGARIEIIRLDTQLAPLQRLPDAVYVCRRGLIQEIWIVEFQSRNKLWPAARASECVVDAILRCCDPSTLASCEIRVIEVRIRQASQGDSGSIDLHGRLASGREDGLLGFQPSNVLVDADPASARFASAATWPFLAFSRRVSAEQLIDMHVRLANCTDAHPKEIMMRRQLLGHVGRARFPNDRRMWQLHEVPMNMKAASTGPWQGRDRLTDAEWHRIVDDAILRAYTDLPERDRLVWLAGEEEGKLEGKLEGAREFARQTLAAVVPAEHLSDLMAELAGLQTPEEFQAFTIDTLRRHR